ncbi:MAG: hypothetical protein ACOH12_15820 [Parvibaculaceae bacterium]
MRHILLALSFLIFAAAPARAADPASVEWQVGDGLYLAGRDITVARNVEGSLNVTGETISVADSSTVKGDTWIAGRHVAVGGTIKGDLFIRAQDGLINGDVKGNVSFYGGSLVFGPDAHIDGDVSYYTASPAEIDKGATIKGTMKSGLFRSDPRDEDGFATRPSLPPRPHSETFASVRQWSLPGYDLSWAGSVFFGFLAGLVAALWPAESIRLGDALRREPFPAVAFGALIFFGVPILALVALVTIIGIPLTFVLLLLWLLLLPAGVVAVIAGCGALIDERLTFADAGLARRLAGVLIATVVLRIGFSLPVLGTLFWFCAILAGIGTLFLSGRSRLPK